MGQPGCPLPRRAGAARPDPPTGSEMGKPGFPIPLHEGQALLRAGGWGNQVPPWSRETVMRMAHTARCNRPGSAGVPPAPRRRGHGAGPRPDPPPLGAGTRRLPPAGGGWEGGCTRRTMVTLAVHAAPPHTDGMKKGCSWEGCALPDPPVGRDPGARASGPRPLRYGETRFPHTPAPAAYFHVSRGAGRGAEPGARWSPQPPMRLRRTTPQ